MPKSNFTQQREFYNRILSEDYSKSEVSQEYKKVLDALLQLSICADDIQSDHNPDGFMTTDTYRNISDAYKNVMIACGEFLTKNAKYSKFENSRINIVKELGSVAAKDLKVLNGLDKEHPGTLKDAIKKARISTLHYSGKDLKRVGGAQSNRIPIKKDNGQKGYFTKATTYNLDKVWTEAVTKRIKDIPKQYHHIFEKLKTDTDLQNKFVAGLPMSVPFKKFDKDITGDLLATPLEKIGIGNYQEIMDAFEKNEKMGQAVLDFVQDMLKHKVTVGMMQAVGIKKNARLDQRNCAMSDMARLLGCSSIIAEAKPMEIIIDGEAVDGVFMENVEGIDINHIPKNFDAKSTKKDNFFNANSLSQLADMQVLDYICGNVDRHDANIIYNFEKLPDGTYRVNGIKGIDNDCSFGTLILEKDSTVYLKMAGPSGIGFITEEMAEKLENIDIHGMKLMLANDELSSEEIEAASNRLNQIKEMVAEKKIQIMKKDDWSKESLHELAKKSEYFKRMNDLAENFSMRGNGQGIMEQTEFADSKEFNSTNIFTENYSKLEKFKEALDHSYVKLHRDSQEFTAMKESYEKVLEIAVQCKKNYTDKNQELPEVENQKFLKAMKELTNCTNTYIMAKGLSPSTGYGKLRLQMAKDLRDFANDYMNNYETKTKADPLEMKEPENEMEL